MGNVHIQSYTRRGKHGEEVSIHSYEQQRALKEKDIREIQDYIVKNAPNSGYKIVDTDFSDTTDRGFGISAYVYLFRPEEKFSLKIRISDHSIGDRRIAEEQSIFSLDDAKSFLNGKWVKFRKNTYRFQTMQIKASQIIEGDQIQSEFTTNKGVKYARVKRPIFETYYKLERQDNVH